MAELPPELREGDDPPGAAWYGKLINYLRSVQLQIGKDSGLIGSSGPNGITLAVDRRAVHGFAVTTMIIPAATAASKKFGRGTAKLQRTYTIGLETYYADIPGPDQVILNGSPTKTVASGRLVQWKWIDGKRHIDVDYC